MDYKHSETKWMVAICFFVFLSVILNIFAASINKELFILLQLIITSGLLYVFYQLIKSSPTYSANLLKAIKNYNLFLTLWILLFGFMI